MGKYKPEKIPFSYDIHFISYSECHNWSDCNGSATYKLLARKQTINHVAKLARILNGWVLLYKLSGRGCEYCCRHVNFRYRACFKQRVIWYSGKYRV